MEGTQTSSTARVRRVPAVSLQVPNGGGGSGVMKTGDIKRRRTAEGGNLMEPNPAEAENGVAARIGLRNPNVPTQQRTLQRVYALLRVVRHHRKISSFRHGRRRSRRRRDLESGARVGGVEPGGENGAAAAPVEVSAAGLLDAAEELVGEVEAADLGLGLDWEGRDGVWACVLPGF